MQMVAGVEDLKLMRNYIGLSYLKKDTLNLDSHTYTHTHIYIYIYIYMFVKSKVF